jgi:two-component system sensor histidine kinase KdpD
LEKILRDRKIDINLPEDLPAIPMDCLLIEQVFVNLLENAVRHTPSGSGIEISAKRDGETVNVAVADLGPGLKEEELKLVFDKFYRGKSSPGAGLGLAICKAIVTAHDGKIWVENRPEKGAAFQFTLPLGGSNE